MIFTSEEMHHYSRHFALPEIGIAGQKRLKAARVLCVGAGGLGSAALHYLAAAGIGTLGIIDHDVVEASNLQRQILYTTNDLGSLKAITAQKRLRSLNRAIEIIAHPVKLTKDNGNELIDSYDLIIDGSDNFLTRYLISTICFLQKKPHIYASISQFQGQCSIFNAPQGPCYRCLYDEPPPPDTVPNCNEGGVLGVLPGLLGCIQATETIKLILNIGDPLIGRLWVFNALTLQCREFAIQANPDCRLCAHHELSLPIQQPRCTSRDESTISANELANLMQKSADAYLLLDVREPHEHKSFNIGGQSCPLSKLQETYHTLPKNKLIIVYCQHGIRSYHALQFLKTVGFTELKHLTGGIATWIN